MPDLRQTCSALQLYLPRIPGVPNDFAYLPDRFGLEYEVQSLLALTACAWRSRTHLCIVHSCMSSAQHSVFIALAQDVYFRTKDGTKLHSWKMWPSGWSKEQRRQRPTVLFFQARRPGHSSASHPKRMHAFGRPSPLTSSGMVAHIRC